MKMQDHAAMGTLSIYLDRWVWVCLGRLVWGLGVGMCALICACMLTCGLNGAGLRPEVFWGYPPGFEALSCIFIFSVSVAPLWAH